MKLKLTLFPRVLIRFPISFFNIQLKCSFFGGCLRFCSKPFNISRLTSFPLLEDNTKQTRDLTGIVRNFDGYFFRFFRNAGLDLRRMAFRSRRLPVLRLFWAHTGCSVFPDIGAVISEQVLSHRETEYLSTNLHNNLNLLNDLFGMGDSLSSTTTLRSYGKLMPSAFFL